MEPAPKRQKSTVCSGCEDVFKALEAQHPSCVHARISAASCVLDKQLARKLLCTAASHPAGAASKDATSTPDCTACLQAVLQHGFFSLVQKHSECYQYALVHVAGQLARIGCTSCLTQLLSTQHMTFDSWSLVMSCEMSSLSAMELLLSAAPERWQPELCRGTLRQSFSCSILEYIALRIPLMDLWLQSSKLVNRPDVCLELLALVLEKGCADCLKHLVVMHKADVDAAAHGSELTLLQQACRKRGQRDSTIVQALVQHGADVYAVTDDRGENALHLTVRYAERGSAASNVQNIAAMVSQANRDYQAAVTAAAPAATAVATAAAAVAATLRRLVSQQNCEGQTPLHALLCRCGAKWGPARSPASELLRPLLEIDSAELRKALPLQDSAGRTALHMAVEEQHLEALQQLLAAGAELNMLPVLLRIPDSSGADVLCLAKRAGKAQLLSLLAQYTSEVRCVLCSRAILY
jgi:Ankyrin repeat